MPAFVPSISVHLHKLLENCRLASHTLDREFCRVVKVTVCHEYEQGPQFEALTDFPAVLVIGVIGTKERIAFRACKVLYVILFAWSSA